METTPKTNQVYSVLKEAVTTLYAFDYMVGMIESPYDEYTEGFLKELRECSELCKGCQVKVKEVYDECWAICRGIDDLPKMGDLLKTRFDNICKNCDEVFEREFMQETLDNLARMKEGKWISGRQHKEIIPLLISIHDFVVKWDYGFDDILGELGNSIPEDEYLLKEQEVIAQTGKHLPNRLSVDEAKILMDLLIDKKLISNGTKEDAFLFWFGCGSYKEGIKPIKWQGTVQIARELLEGLYKETVKPFATIERIVPEIFVKGGKPMVLAKPKKKPSFESDAIAVFLATL